MRECASLGLDKPLQQWNLARGDTAGREQEKQGEGTRWIEDDNMVIPQQVRGSLPPSNQSIIPEQNWIRPWGILGALSNCLCITLFSRLPATWSNVVHPHLCGVGWIQDFVTFPVREERTLNPLRLTLVPRAKHIQPSDYAYGTLHNLACFLLYPWLNRRPPIPIDFHLF